MRPIKRMLVPTDFSPASDVALTYALEMALVQGCTVHLLNVIDDASFATAYPDGFYVELPGLRAQLIEEATDRLEAMAEQCRAAGVTATREVAVGRPARVIVETATSRGSDLVVMGTHGRSGFAHLVLGSVAERVVRTAPCPVLTVRDTVRLAELVGAHGAAHHKAADVA